MSLFLLLLSITMIISLKIKLSDDLHEDHLVINKLSSGVIKQNHEITDQDLSANRYNILVTLLVVYPSTPSEILNALTGISIETINIIRELTQYIKHPDEIVDVLPRVRLCLFNQMKTMSVLESAEKINVFNMADIDLNLGNSILHECDCNISYDQLNTFFKLYHPRSQDTLDRNIQLIKRISENDVLPNLPVWELNLNEIKSNSILKLRLDKLKVIYNSKFTY